MHALVDGAGNFKLKLGNVNRMKEAGIEFVVYDRERWHHRKPDINHRTHRKLLVVDGAVGFTGGVCIDDAWQGKPPDEVPIPPYPTGKSHRWRAAASPG